MIDYTDYTGFESYIPNQVFSTLLGLRNRVVMLITGGRFGKTRAITRKNVYRIMGISPVKEHNIKPEDSCRIFRMAAENLPNDAEGEVKNTIYPAFKAQLPKNLLVKDITARVPTMKVQPCLGGKFCVAEFVSYGQTTQSGAGVER
ncbi:MAG: hypothetical protein IMZ64_01125, partial [Bacteroidetes bacterium]|nr:hypothetical protein [Bacteroidota bacterium]